MNGFEISGTLLKKYTGSDPNPQIPANITDIGDGAFSGSYIECITISQGVMAIGVEAFKECDKLKSITLPQGLISIGKNAFEYCVELESIAIPPSVTSIGSGAFFGCWRLKRVDIADLKAWCNINFDVSANPLDEAHNLYLNNRPVTELVIPQGVTEIKDYAFEGFGGTSVGIPESVTAIGKEAFKRCINLKSITIPASVAVMEASVFESAKHVKIYCEAPRKPQGWHDWWNVKTVVGRKKVIFKTRAKTVWRHSGK